MSRKWWIVLAACGALSVGVAACGGDDDGGGSGGGGDLSGTVSADGSSTVGPLTEIAAEQFQAENSGVRVTVGTSGTGGGFEKFCVGETDMNDASRQIEPEEEDVCAENGVSYDEVQIANDGLAVALNPNNPVDCLTVDQLKQIWDKGSKVSNWSEIDGLDPSFDADMELFGPGTDSGTFDYFTDVINGEEGRQRTDYNNVGEDDNQTVRGVAGNDGGIGYFGLSYIQENPDEVKAAEIDGGDGCVAPSTETVQDGTYTPLGRPLFIYPSQDASGSEPMSSFLTYYVDNAQSIAEAALFVPLTDDQLADSESKVSSITGG